MKKKIAIFKSWYQVVDTSWYQLVPTRLQLKV